MPRVSVKLTFLIVPGQLACHLHNASFVFSTPFPEAAQFQIPVTILGTEQEPGLHPAPGREQTARNPC